MSQEQQQPKKASAESSEVKEWLGCLFWIAIVVFLGYWAISSWIGPAFTGVLDKVPPRHQIELLWKARPGANVRITSRDTPVFLGRTRDDYSKFREIQRIGDSFGYVEMIEESRIIVVSSGQKALVLEKFYLMVKVRMLEGDQAGRAGWGPLSRINMEGRAK